MTQLSEGMPSFAPSTSAGYFVSAKDAREEVPSKLGIPVSNRAATRGFS